MAVVRLEPVRELMSIQDRMNRMFDEAFGEGRSEREAPLEGSWTPAVDIYEMDGDIVIKAELPGIDPASVDLRLENTVLTLKGERKFDDSVARENHHRIERAYGVFSRSFTLPSDVDHDRITADYRDGILRVRMPKREDSKPKSIRISVGR